MTPTQNKDLNALLREYEERGWKVEPRRGKHLGVRPPAGPMIFIPRTPSDRRALLNIRKMFERVARGEAP